ncbi:IS110 family transposase [Shinella sp. BYT-45]|uniref:IS110 family transposase n=1 Tax=Shinella sp. BYT-45 TaxID=3377377 RepID=UPI00397EF126
MIHERLFVGIDVCKTRFDVFVHPSGERFSCPASPAGIDALVRHVRGLGPCAVGLEASGGYERKLAESQHAAGIAVYILSPGRVRHLACALGQMAKTDAIDAAMIAAYLAAAHERLTPFRPDAVRHRLGALAAHRRRIVAERSGLVSQCDTEDEPLVRAMIEERIATIAKDLLRIDKEMRALLAQAPAMKRRYDRLCAVKGVGPVLATGLLADLPELGTVSAKAIAALVGVAPHPRQSGASARKGRCSGGRKHLRDIAYMAVLSAIKAKDPVLAGFYQRLRSKGKPFKLAMVATIRKFVTILNAIARTDPAFKP